MTSPAIVREKSVDCPNEHGVNCALADTVSLLRDEVVRLNRSVAKLEVHAAGMSVRARDIALTIAGGSLSLAAVVWVIGQL